MTLILKKSKLSQILEWNKIDPSVVSLEKTKTTI